VTKVTARLQRSCALKVILLSQAIRVSSPGAISRGRYRVFAKIKNMEISKNSVERVNDLHVNRRPAGVALKDF
jgi:hypothetical protein